MMLWPRAAWNLSLTKYGTLLGWPTTSMLAQTTYDASSDALPERSICPEKNPLARQ